MSVTNATHSGSGPINQAQGDQLNNFGNGPVYSAHTINIGSIGQNQVETSKPEVDDCLATLFPTLRSDPLKDRERILERKGKRTDGTCQWIKSNQLYEAWLHSDSAQLLWLSGGPGMGKTMLSIFVAEELEQLVEQTAEDTLLLEFFCDNKDDSRNKGESIIRGLIYQLLLKRPSLSGYVLPTFRIQKSSLFADSSAETLWDIFKSMVCDQTLGTVYCVLDGLDECNDQSLEAFLKRLKALFPVERNLRIILVSRALPDLIPEILSKFPHIDLGSSSEIVQQDIHRFIDNEVNDLATYRQYPEDLRLHVRETFQNRAQSTFLWVGIVAKMLRKYRATQVEQALELFPPGLEDIYTRILLQIDKDRRMIVAQILNFVTTAVRPLTLAELGALLEPTISGSSSTILNHNDQVQDYILDCGYFLTFKEEEVNLIHQSAKEYLQGKSPDSYPELDIFFSDEQSRHSKLAKRCFDYLHNGPLADGPVHIWGDASPVRTFPLLPYAVIHWPRHAKNLPCTEEIFNLSLPFYATDNTVRSSWIQSHPDYGQILGLPEPSELLHVACYLAILPLVQNILQQKGILARIKRYSQIHKLDRLRRRPLHIAASLGHVAIAQVLLESGADIEARDYNEETALFAAARNSQLAMMRFLLENWGANIKARRCYKETVLHLGVRKEHEAVIGLLLEKGLSLEVRDSGQGTPLHLAVIEGNEGIIRRLLERGANIEAKRVFQHTPLHSAVSQGYPTIVQLLLEKGANIEAKTEDQETPLHLAADDGYENTVRLLLEKGADIEARDKLQETPLHLAAKRARVSVVQLLLEKGAYVHAKDSRGRTALHATLSMKSYYQTPGKTTIAQFQLLLAKGADLKAKDGNGQTALHYAAKQSIGYEGIVQFLLDNGADAGAKDNHGTTALQIAVEKDDEEMVRLLTPLTPAT